MQKQKKVKYLVIVEFENMDLGLRELKGFYYLDILFDFRGVRYAINKFKEPKSKYKHLFEQKENNVTDSTVYNTVLSNIIHEFLKNVK